jgi:hypothetical protein
VRGAANCRPITFACHGKPILRTAHIELTLRVPPTSHWELDADGQPTQQIKGFRRRAEFVTPIPKPRKRMGLAVQQQLVLDEGKGLSTADQQYDLTSAINELRQNVDRWRALPNPNDWRVMPETARLLQHWRSHKFNDIRPFFCQVEAVETAIWLTEVAPEAGKFGKQILDRLVRANEESNPEISRLALKLATGAGKTTVMAMLIAWQTINAIRHHRQPGGPDAVAYSRRSPLPGAVRAYGPSVDEVARPGRSAESQPVRPAQADRSPVARRLSRLQGGTFPDQLKYKTIADMACDRIVAAITRAHMDARPIVATPDPYNPTGSTAYVRFNTSRTERWETDSRRCHVNWVILDSGWEAEFCRVAEAHPRVRAYVKNHGLGLEVPYRFGTEMRKYLPDFIVRVDDGRGEENLLNLIVEIKGYRQEDAKAKKETMETYWIPGVNRLGCYGRWAFVEFGDVWAMEADFREQVAAGVDAMVARFRRS